MVTGDITFALMLGIASLAFVQPALVRSLADRWAPRSAATG
jgi:hypothetical protein